MKLEMIIAECAKLTPQQRAELMGYLQDQDNEDPTLTPEQAQELERRVKMLEAGELSLIPADIVLADLRARCGI